jgi:hypothetical protein
MDARDRSGANVRFGRERYWLRIFGASVDPENLGSNTCWRSSG